MSNTILIVDDDEPGRQALSYLLHKAGYSTTAVGHPAEALEHLQTSSYALLLLDLQLPDIDGLTLLHEVRRLAPRLPVLIITAYGSFETAIGAWRNGARDYITKPFDAELVLARVRAVLNEQHPLQQRAELLEQMEALLDRLRQVEGAEHPVSASPLSGLPPRFLRRGALTIDLKTRQAMLAGEGAPITLAQTDFQYLVTLARHAPDPLSCQQLVQEAQGYRLSAEEAQAMARSHIHGLRKALEPDPQLPRYILTVRGIGYYLAL